MAALSMPADCAALSDQMMASAELMVDLMAFFTQMLKRILAAVSGFGEIHDARSLIAYVEEQVKDLGALASLSRPLLP